SDLCFDFFEEAFSRDFAGRLLLVATARPELLTARPHWPTGPLGSTTVRLPPLSTTASAALVASVGSTLAPEILDRVVARSGGVPLYAEEFARLAVDRDRLGAETAPDLPDAIAAVLQARLDSLPAVQRRLLQCAAVAGDPFWTDQIAAIAGAADIRSP